MEKEDYKKKMEQGRFLPVTEELFALYDKYEAICINEQDKEGLLWVSFYKGEAFFRVGKYQQAQLLLNDCILKFEPHTEPTLVENCYNILGLIYYAMGYEFLSMQNYLQALKVAEENKDFRKKIIIQINIGWLYRDLGDYERALDYYVRSRDDLKFVEGELDYDLQELCECYIAQIYFMTGRSADGMQILQKVEDRALTKEEIFYEATQQNMKIHGYYYLKNQEKLQENIDLVVENAGNADDFLEMSESYLDICNYLIQINQEGARRLLRVLRKNCDLAKLPYLDLKMKRLELEYAKRYLDRASYLEECGRYIEIRSEFELHDKLSKAENMAIVEKLEKTKAEKERYQEKSRHDLLTGLLNKISFGETVSLCMEDAESVGVWVDQTVVTALAVIDIDYFKQINDQYGHIAGDSALTEISKLMQQTFGEKALLGRIGGDEFAVFWFRYCSKAEIIERVERFHEGLRQYRCHTSKGDFQISASVGVKFLEETMSFEKMFRQTDEALYRAKEQGRNRTIICNEGE